MRLVHVVNSCRFAHATDLARAQDVTFDAIRRARAYAGLADLPVDVVSVTYPEDAASVPEDVEGRSTLTGSVQDDVPGARRRLPRIADLLAHGLVGTEATHAVYTNIDIAVVPHFYVAVAAMLAAGSPSLIINRRTIPDFAGRDRLPALEVMAGFAGQRHPGRDCFAFPVGAAAEFLLGRTVIGADGVGRVLQWNLEAVCGPVNWRKDLHLTFHLGDDQDWRDPVHAPVNDFNRRQTLAVYDALVARHGPFERFPNRPEVPDADGV